MGKPRTPRATARTATVLAVGVALMLVPLLLASTVGASSQAHHNALANGHGDDGRRVNEREDNERHDTSPPLRDIAPILDRSTQNTVKREPSVEAPGPLPGGADPVIQSTPATAAAPALGVGFDGVGQGFAGPAGTFTVNSAPPDTNGAAGPNHYFQIVNSSFAIFNKAGTVVYGPSQTNTLWSGFGGACQTNNDGDATVAYDRLSDRWIVSQFSVTGAPPFYQCVAVSTTSDPTGSYYRYAFQYSNFPDYPKLGVWPDAYYTTFDMFNSAGTTYLGPEVCAYDRAKMLLGQPATQQCFTLASTIGPLLPADVDGTTAPPAGAPNYLVAFDTNTLLFWKFHVDWTTPANSTLTGATSLPVAAFTTACSGACIPQSGTSQKLDSLSDRLMYRLAYRNFGDHESLVVNHSVAAGTSSGLRWYEIRNPGTTPTVYQQGTYAPDASYRWMGSVAMDHAGNIGLGFSISSSTRKPGLHYTGRLAGDPLGTMTQGEGTVIDGAGSQLPTLSRWGDYSSMSIDPTDDCTFWFTSEYLAANGTFNWHTRVGTFKFASCSTAPSDFSLSASPAALSIAQAGSGTSTISTAVTSGSPQSVALTATGQPAGTTVSFSPSSVNSGGSSTMTVSVGGSTAPGTYPITVTGTSATATHTTSVTLTVTASDFSLNATPSALTLAQAGSGTSTIGTSIVSGSAQNVALSASGQPTGTTVSFAPTSVTAGNASTMTVSVGASTTPGAYTITVTGTGESATHSAVVSLTVTASDFSVAASPTNLSIQQGANGTSTISTAVTNGAAQSVTLSASGQPSGVTIAFNPATVTAGGSSTMTITVGGSAAPGSYPVTVTGTGATGATHTATVNLTVTAAPPSDFALTASPSSLTLAQGTSGTSSIGTAVLSGAASTITFSASGQPIGTTVSFNPTSVTAGAASTMTINVGTSTATGSYTITVTGTSPTATHTVTVSLTVTTPPQVVANGGFEAGTYASWTRAGAFLPVISTTTPHTGTYDSRNGSTSPFNGNSTITQTVAVPTGSPVLTFWYQPHCTDTLTYDQIQAQIRSTAGSTLATVLNVCSNSGVWTKVTYSMTAYAGQTVVLWFNDHDDNWPSDPTYFLLDDIAVG